MEAETQMTILELTENYLTALKYIKKFTRVNKQKSELQNW